MYNYDGIQNHHLPTTITLFFIIITDLINNHQWVLIISPSRVTRCLQYLCISSHMTIITKCTVVTLQGRNLAETTLTKWSD